MSSVTVTINVIWIRQTGHSEKSQRKAIFIYMYAYQAAHATKIIVGKIKGKEKEEKVLCLKCFLVYVIVDSEYYEYLIRQGI